MKFLLKTTGLLSVFLLLGACGANENLQSRSALDSVDIPQTPVVDQQKIGFCWAYAGIGLVESDFKLRSGNEIALSEESLGFYRMAEGLHLLTQSLAGSELQSAIREGSLEGWLLKADESFPDTFALIKKYGVVPESVWSYKFTTEQKSESLTSAIKLAMLRLVKQNNPRTIAVEDIINGALLAPGAWQSAPPKSFVVDGRPYTPVSYLESIGFNPDSFASVEASKPSDVEKIIAATKRALVRGVSVPLGYPVNFARLAGDTFSGKNVDLNNPKNFFKEGGHAVLISDFVNQGSVEGALPLSQLMVEFLRPTKDLNYFVFKNSWGKEAKTNEAGRVISGSKTGFYKIDREYMVGAANMTSDSDFAGIIQVVVPVDIARDPFGTESINPAIAAK